MKRLLVSSALILTAATALTIGSTGAFFSDTETSSGNTFSAGAIDLKVDNTSYYNGIASPNTSWQLVDLTIEKFFNFLDLKPGDYGEDTISLHVNTNDAYLCANVTLTSDEENGIIDPETTDGDTTSGPGQGELADAVNFIWWADDGDNVLEVGEPQLPGGPLGALTIGATSTVALADSATNIWTGTGGPAPGDQTLYIGKAWCFGGIAAAPLAQAAYPLGPAGDNNSDATAGTPADGGVSCSGAGLNNVTQTDTLTANISFSATQSRNNPGFLCGTHCPIGNVNLFVAGAGFETPEVTNGAQWDVFSSPSGGWDVAWRSDVPPTFGAQTRPAIAKMELHEGVLGTAQEGDQYVELDSDWGGPADAGDGEPASTVISQAITTVPGRNYQIRYAFAARPNTPASENSVEVRWGGVVVDTAPPTAGAAGPIVWNDRVINVVATTTSTRISFGDLGTANSLGSFVDNMRIFGEQCLNVAVDAQ